jgi:N-acetylglucosaminyldiphosphoundecaprenol N-acetyl-beta-D-mannosaminyltransferase
MTGDTAELARNDVLGLPIDAVTMQQALTRCTAAIRDSGYLSIGVINAAKVVSMRRDVPLRQAVVGCDLVLADGQSVVWASRVLGSPLPERVAGIDLFMELLAEADRRHHRVYFLGARQQVLDQMLAEVARRFPGLVIAGSRNGYFGPDDEAEVTGHIREAGADLLFVGMSSPKKELFLNRWGRSTGARVVHGVGGSFDVLAGLTQRAPLWYQRHGLEWLYRAKQEPVRLGRRYLATNMSFISLVALESLRARSRPRPAGPGGMSLLPPGATSGGEDHR